MTRFARIKDDSLRYSVFSIQMASDLKHGLLNPERCCFFRVIRVFRGCSFAVAKEAGA
jgi:hypothetical protein